MFEQELNIGQVVSNGRIHDIFGGQTQGGIRLSNEANAMVLISGFGPDAEYDDRWEGDTIYYHGPTLNENAKTDSDREYGRFGLQLKEQYGPHPGKQRKIFLFSKVLVGIGKRDGKGGRNGALGRTTMFQFEGEVVPSPSEKPWKTDGGWIFPLVKASDLAFETDERWVLSGADGISDDEIWRRAREAEEPEKGTGEGRKKVVSRSEYRRSGLISGCIKREAKSCDLCGAVPFWITDKTPYLEIHHIKWLSRGGKDRLDNVVALCPNCHRKMHVLNNGKDVEKLKKIASERAKAHPAQG
ncbi:HNH endonuclease [Collinsella sp. SGI.178]|uniref:HNH endonuclease n=1 Tax=Collinsella sp. SGI.178 TaxID=3420554 RepID=UPI003D024AA0